MQNVLIFPTKRKSQFNVIKKFIDAIQEKKEREYSAKIELLKNESYKYYLKIILKERHDVVDFPDFIYHAGIAVCSEAKRLSEIAISLAEAKGKKHIEQCYKDLKKRLARK